MVHPRLCRILISQFCVAAALLSGCASTPTPVVAVAKSEWTLAPHKDSRSSVTLRKGDSAERVIDGLGEPRRKLRDKKKPGVVVFLYERIIIGPLAQRIVKSAHGEIFVRQNIRYVDSVDVTLIDGLVDTISVSRKQQTDEMGFPLHL